MGVHSGPARTNMSGGYHGGATGEAELAQAIAEIAREDPVAAASLLGIQGVQDDALLRASRSSATPTMSLSDVVAASEEFDIDVTFTIGVVGNAGAGKSSLLRRFARGSFSEEQQRTIVVEFVEKRLVLNGDQEATFHIWDAPGDDEPRTVVQNSCKKVKACLVVFATNDRSSFDAVPNWMAALRDISGADTVLALAQTKSDLFESSESCVSDQEARSLALEFGVELFVSSACDGTGTREAFEFLGKELLTRELAAEDRFRAGEARGGVQWGDSIPENEVAWA